MKKVNREHLATIGLMAMIDKATGYEKVRPKGDLGRALAGLEMKELLDDDTTVGESEDRGGRLDDSAE